MGCQLSKRVDDTGEKTTMDDSIAIAAEATASNTSNVDVNYKSRFEWKMCVARDTPEPEFDLSDCMLKEVPSGVFVLCRILLKERLRLNNNLLRSLNGGGALSDLRQLHSIDLSSNRFQKLPDDLHALQNLRELFLSNNQIVALPLAISKLRNLELLDVSFNALQQIDQIVHMPKLRVLILNGNKQLRRLPVELTTCDSLTDISIDVDCIEYPPPAVTSRGTLHILQYLLTGIVVLSEESDTPASRIKSATEEFIAIEKGQIPTETYARPQTSEKNKREQSFIEHERSEHERYQNMDALLHQQSQQRKQELLRNLLHQQNETDSLLKQLQQEKDVERDKLIGNILQAEESAGVIVEQLISLKNGPDAALLEQERIEEERLLEQLHIDHAELRKRDVLTAMSETLDAESRQIQMYHEQRDAVNRTLLERETSATNHENLVRNMDRDKQNVIALIADDENWQKIAVAKFIEQNDARTWGLVEQVRLVESQLATMTQCEIERKKCEMNERLNDLGDKRVNLTYVLMDLLDQQKQRKQELLSTLQLMEAQKEKEQQDFWLLQYQKLLDSKPSELSFKASSIDPLLGYYFLVNGVVHCIPFLSKLWQSNTCNIADLTDADFEEAGIKIAIDRENILLSIREFLEQQNKAKKAAEVPVELAEEVVPTAPEYASTSRPQSPSVDLVSECVICMDNPSKIVFLPCGHLCCCTDCDGSVELCPMCRATIERRIKVISA